jgi:hypothetical protein
MVTVGSCDTPSRRRTYQITMAVVLIACSACDSKVATDEAMLRDLSREHARTGLALAQVWGNQVTISSFGERLETRSLPSGIYFLGATFHPEGGWFAGPTTGHGLVAMTLRGEVLWSFRDVESASSCEWSHDGTRLAFAGKDRNSGFLGIQILEIATKRLAAVRAGGLDPSWSPADTELAYSAEGQIWIHKLEDQTFRAIGLGTKPAWSPNGRWISYHARDGRLRLIGPDGEGGPEVGGGMQALSRAGWAPDSQYLAFVRRGSRGLQLGLDCIEPRQLTVARLHDSGYSSVHQLCKGAPADFRWILKTSVQGVAAANSFN